MAVRRGIGQALSSGGDLIGLYIRDMMERDRMREQARLQQQNALYNKGLETVAGRVPKSAEAGDVLTNALGLPPGVMPSQHERSSGVVAGFQGKTGGQLPAGQSALDALLTEAGVNLDPTYGEMPQQKAPPGVLPSRSFGPVKPPEQQFAESGLADARQQARKYEPTTDLDYYSMATHTKERQKVPQSEAASYGALIQEPPPEERGRNTLIEAQTGELHPAMALAKSQFENAMRDATGPSVQKFEAGKAGAIEYAQTDANLNPKFVDIRVDEANRKARGGAEAQRDFGQPNQSELTASGVTQILTGEHAQSINLEAGGTRLVTGAQTAAQSPFASQAFEMIPGMQLTEDQKAYANSALNFAAQVGKIMSGVQVRPDERDIFTGTLFALPSDSHQIIELKQRRRAAFIAAGAMMTGRGGHAAGVAIASAIKNGTLPPEMFVGSNPMVDTSGAPEVMQGIMEGLNQ